MSDAEFVGVAILVLAGVLFFKDFAVAGLWQVEALASAVRALARELEKWPVGKKGKGDE